MNAIRNAGITVLLAAAMSPAATFAQNSSDAIGAPALSGAPHTGRAVRKADRLLERRIRAALVKAKIDSRALTVLAKGGAVTLLGGAPDTTQIQRAGDVAKQVPGVTSVDNRLVQHSDQQ